MKTIRIPIDENKIRREFDGASSNAVRYMLAEAEIDRQVRHAAFKYLDSEYRKWYKGKPSILSKKSRKAKR